ncbi:MAG: hypothetical protein RR256_06015, partial [Bacteroidales bacterium]
STTATFPTGFTSTQSATISLDYADLVPKATTDTTYYYRIRLTNTALACTEQTGTEANSGMQKVRVGATPLAPILSQINGTAGTPNKQCTSSDLLIKADKSKCRGTLLWEYKKTGDLAYTSIASSELQSTPTTETWTLAAANLVGGTTYEIRVKDVIAIQDAASEICKKEAEATYSIAFTSPMVSSPVTVQNGTARPCLNTDVPFEASAQNAQSTAADTYQWQLGTDGTNPTNPTYGTGAKITPIPQFTDYTQYYVRYLASHSSSVCEPVASAWLAVRATKSPSGTGTSILQDLGAPMCASTPTFDLKFDYTDANQALLYSGDASTQNTLLQTISLT